MLGKIVMMIPQNEGGLPPEGFFEAHETGILPGGV